MYRRRESNDLLFRCSLRLVLRVGRACRLLYFVPLTSIIPFFCLLWPMAIIVALVVFVLLVLRLFPLLAFVISRWPFALIFLRQVISYKMF